MPAKRAPRAKAQPATKNGGDLSFEGTLWKAADELREELRSVKWDLFCLMFETEGI